MRTFEQWGRLHSCDLCGATFYAEDYVARHGRQNYNEMMQSGGYILCPACECKLGVEEQDTKKRVKTSKKNMAAQTKLARYEPKAEKENKVMKMKQANGDIRAAVKNAGVKLWMVAAEIGVSDATMSRWLRFERSDSEKQRFLKAVEAAKSKYGETDEAV